MLAILFYCLKVLLCSGLLFGYYLLALRNKQFHGWNRYYLISAVLLSFTVPFIKIPILFSADNQDSSLVLRGLQIAHWGDETIIKPSNYWHIDWQNTAVVLYCVISLFFVFQLLKTIFWIKKISRENPSEMLEDVTIYNTSEAGTPFSFFKNIFWHKAIEPNSSKGLQMLRHELAHVHQWHSADKMLLEITTILAWWNPFFYLIKKELSTIHEFIADQQAAHGDDHLQYASLLLSKAFGSNNMPITNPFFHSQLKRRIMMLTTIKTPKFSYLRRMMVLPLAAGMVVLFAFKYKKANADNQLKSPSQITVVIDAGHGGNDDGAIGINGIKEKDICLAIAQKIMSLASQKNINVVLTRNTDELPGGFKEINAGIKQRINAASENNADIFISIHVNSGLKSENKSGIEAFVTSKINKTSQKSNILASSLLDELENSGLPVMKNINQRKEQGVWVLDANPLPAVILELGYINNPTDAAFITDPKNQEKMANEILNAIVKIAPGIKAQSSTNVSAADTKVLQGNLPDSEKIKKTPQKVYVVNMPDSSKKITNVIATKDKDAIQITMTSKDGKKSSPINISTDSTKPQPLYVIDGVVQEKADLKDINPNQIQSINVLKDKSAIDKYGEKAKNGVIEINLKPTNDHPAATNVFLNNLYNSLYQNNTKKGC